MLDWLVAQSRRGAKLLAPLLVVVMSLPAAAGGAGQYMTLEAFLVEAFGASAPDSHTYWLGSETKAQIQQRYGQGFSKLRVRYWQQGSRTAWVLEEIGKELPITIGVVVDQQRIAQVAILEFRESRGWEVRHPFFTRQFAGATLESGMELSTHIDGITGATLSVRAVKKVAQLALLFHSQVDETGDVLTAGTK